MRIKEQNDTRVIINVRISLSSSAIFNSVYRNNPKKSDKFDFLTLFNIYFALLYPLPAFVLAFDFDNSASDMAVGISLYTNNIQTALAIFAGYFLVLIGFYSKSAKTFGKNIIIKDRDNNLIVLVFAIFLLLLSCLSIYIYGLQYGGIVTAVAKTSMIRAQAVKGGNLVFFVRFTMYSSLASYLLYSFVFIKKYTQAKFFIFITFCFSVIASLTALAMSGARAGFMYYFLTYYYVYIIKTQKFSWLFFSILLTCTVIFLFYGKLLFYSLSAIPDGYDAVINIITKDVVTHEEFNFYNFIHNFQHTVFSLDVAFSANYQPRWFVDFIYAFNSLIPDRFLGTEEVQTIVAYNTEYIVGSVASQNVAIPPGFLAFGIYSMWWPGLIILCFTYGWIGRYLQTVIRKHIHDIFWMPFVYILVAQMWVDFMNSDPETFCMLISVIGQDVFSC